MPAAPNYQGYTCVVSVPVTIMHIRGIRVEPQFAIRSCSFLFIFVPPSFHMRLICAFHLSYYVGQYYVGRSYFTA